MEFKGKDNGVTIKIDLDKCTGQRKCVEVCPTGVYVMHDDNKAYADNVDECIECCACSGVCPEGAIWHSSCD